MNLTVKGEIVLICFSFIILIAIILIFYAIAMCLYRSCRKRHVRFENSGAV